MDKGKIVVVSSTVSLLEVLVHSLRNSNNALASEYRDILLPSNLITLEVSRSIAEEAARLRAIHNIRTPDAIQIAAPIHFGATYFLTNDIRLPKLSSLKILVLDELIK
jgi:predicted nucleic acid-binding protein